MPSAAYRTAARASAPSDQILEAVEFTHPDTPGPVRVVNDGEDRMIGGELYHASRIEVVWPDQGEDRLPRARIAVGNVGRLLTEWIERTRGLVGGRARLIRALASTGAVEQSVTLDVGGAAVDATAVRIDLGYGLDLSRHAVALRHDPDTTPAIF